MVWTGINLNGRTFHHVFRNDSMTGVMFKVYILILYVNFFGDAVGPHFISMDINADLDKAHLINEFLKNENIWLMNLPNRSTIFKPHAACLLRSGEDTFEPASTFYNHSMATKGFHCWSESKCQRDS